MLQEVQEMEDRVSVWETEGGALNGEPALSLTGTVNQIEWAERIRTQVNGEFDRVASVLEAAASRQSERDRLDTHAMIAILEDKRVEVMANRKAGYFIHEWQELRDQVRRLIQGDSRYKAIKARADH
jgi:hypothetical protein